MSISLLFVCARACLKPPDRKPPSAAAGGKNYFAENARMIKQTQRAMKMRQQVSN